MLMNWRYAPNIKQFFLYSTWSLKLKVPIKTRQKCVMRYAGFGHMRSKPLVLVVTFEGFFFIILCCFVFKHHFLMFWLWFFFLLSWSQFVFNFVLSTTASLLDTKMKRYTYPVWSEVTDRLEICSSFVVNYLWTNFLCWQFYKKLKIC